VPQSPKIYRALALRKAFLLFSRARHNTTHPAFFGDVALMLWLVIKGATPPALDPTAASPAAG